MSKYHATPIYIDGVRFASKAEGRRYGELRLLERAGVISQLELQPRYPVVVNNVQICRYLADFRYVEGDRTVIEDVKGMVGGTALYRLKKRLVEALYGITITEVRA